ncbi:hypothetical protein A3J13_00805 [Candidatus Daviesbacteria bacterium RIFCSPLOWO2_02_FULL_36_8]|uniref:Plasmid stabilization protein n=1 Tax=Candidatus Daviesbacteria bacterium RIFCSPLOWO2_02_FULL_36_8 TaxID=1797793 RepID=A0A1F5MH66_9BACT|nr:MAG: hypothetical protein A3J13_00805 [Candidatus Daviesbacteria bacterium RIFCSPLOWO2_02_FULL_36_8]
MQINFAKKFKKQYDKADLKTKKAFDKRFELFLQNPFYPLLDNHALTGEYSGCRSIDVTGNWRAIFSEIENKDGKKVVIFELLGTHPQLYK